MKNLFAAPPMSTDSGLLARFLPTIERLTGSQWFLKLKHYEVPVTGHFVEFTVWKGILGDVYPACSDLHFAFCPSEHIAEFNRDINTFSEIPKYLLLFYRSEIEELKFKMDIRATDMGWSHN